MPGLAKVVAETPAAARQKRSLARRAARWALILAGSLAILQFVVTIYFPWNPINCQYVDVDISGGVSLGKTFADFYKMTEKRRG